MNEAFVLELTTLLIPYRSYPGDEEGVISFIVKQMQAWGWEPELLPVTGNRPNIFVRFGTPGIVFTTHLDVVPAPDELFTPKREGNFLYGRGACDAKGIAATMIAVCQRLLAQGASDFGLLLVVGEEEDGIGAKTASDLLQNAGIRFLINGEPTECKIAVAHKGGLGFKLNFFGKACHSGYPEQGIDANKIAIEIAGRLLDTDFGENRLFGKATLSLGHISGGVAGNVISPHAYIEGLIRTVEPHQKTIDLITRLASNSELTITYDVPPTKLLEVPNMPSCVVSFCCDIPFFAPLNVQSVLYGPGSIHRAHTDLEYITGEEIASAINGYEKIFSYLWR